MEDPKGFLKKAAPTQFEVEGTWQSWVADGMGNVLYDLEARHPARWKIISIKKFNVEEYHQRTGQWPRGQVHLNQISYWDHRGRYHTCVPETQGPRRRQEAHEQFQAAMRQATQEILADDKTKMFGGDRPDGRRAADSYDINCGMCEEWANRVAELCPEAVALGVGNLTGNPDDDLEYPHVFIRYKGKFYDCECSTGVSRWNQLPLFTHK